jgi:hypothetical protein
VDTHLPPLRAGGWRTATLVAGAIAAIELVLLVVAGAALLAGPLAHHAKDSANTRDDKKAKAEAKPKPAPAPAKVKRVKAPTVPRLSRRQTTVLVLNGNGTTGAAGIEAGRIQQLGYRVSRVGDASRMDYPTSVVMYRPGFQPEGKRLAHDLRISVVGPLDGLRVRELNGAQAAVVVGH